MKVLNKIKAIKNKKGKALKIVGGTAAVFVVTGTAVLITKKWDYIHADRLLGPNEIMCGSKNPVDITSFDKSKFQAGDMIDLWREGKVVNAIITNVDLEKLKDALMEIDEIKECDSFDVILSGGKAE